MVVHEEFIKNSFWFSWNNISSISISLISKCSPKFKFRSCSYKNWYEPACIWSSIFIENYRQYSTRLYIGINMSFWKHAQIGPVWPFSLRPSIFTLFGLGHGHKDSSICLTVLWCRLHEMGQSSLTSIHRIWPGISSMMKY